MLRPADLAHFTGSDTMYRHGTLRHCIYTGGVRYVAQEAEAYWLIDAILYPAMMKPRIRREPFQVWTLTVKGTTGVLRCEDGNGNKVYCQRIPYTDFPLERITFYYENQVLCLPSER